MTTLDDARLDPALLDRVQADLDHTTPHDDGGPTTRGNLIPLCRRHHRLKTHTRWRYQRLDDGIVEWTDPHGRTWRDPPARE
jgi:hypothetical protein